MLLKNLPKPYWALTIFLRMVLDGVAGIRFFFQGRLRSTWAIVRAHFSFYRHFLHFYRKRQNPTLKSYYTVKSIVWEYFVKGKNKIA